MYVTQGLNQSNPLFSMHPHSLSTTTTRAIPIGPGITTTMRAIPTGLGITIGSTTGLITVASSVAVLPK
jgi:hypothetical protein